MEAGRQDRSRTYCQEVGLVRDKIPFTNSTLDVELGEATGSSDSEASRSLKSGEYCGSISPGDADE